MKSKICCAYDSKAEVYLNPFIAQSTGSAVRGFADAVNDPQGRDSQLALHPEDFTLLELGEWDPQTGIISLYESKKSLGIGLDYKKSDVGSLKVAN